MQVTDDARSGIKCVSVPEGSALEVALKEADATGVRIGLVRGDRRYLLLPLPPLGPISEEEKVQRRALVERAWALRNQQEPLGVTTAELVREARGNSGPP